MWGFPTFVNVTVLLIPASYGWSLMKAGLPFWYLATFTLVLVLSVLVHELGHASALQRQGSRCQKITLHGLGGHVRWCKKCERAMLPSWKLTVALAGPFVGLLLGVAALGLATLAADQATFVILTQVATINLTMNLANLVPIFPLDGGQAAYAVVRMILPTVTHKPVKVVHLALGIVAGGWGLHWAWVHAEPMLGLMAVQIALANLVMLGLTIRGIDPLDLIPD